MRSGKNALTSYQTAIRPLYKKRPAWRQFQKRLVPQLKLDAQNKGLQPAPRAIPESVTSDRVSVALC